MENRKDNLLECCLFFTANSLARAITKMGTEEFAAVGMTPSYAFLLWLAKDGTGISQKELSEHLHIAPSTVSRFVDTLVVKGLLTKEVQGRNVLIFPTEQGRELMPKLEKAWIGLLQRYSDILGKDHGELLTQLTADASRKLSEA
jgi:DNA-binding MarR family transcriptional regulator